MYIRLIHRITAFILYFVPCYMMAINPSIQNVANGIEFKNNHVIMVISNNAEVISCVDDNTGHNIALSNPTKIASAQLKDGTRYEADNVLFQNGVLLISIRDEIVLIRAKAFEDYFTFEVISDSSSIFETITFIDLRFDYIFSNQGAFVVSGIPMSLNTDPVYYPSGENRAAMGRCTKHTGIQGAKLAVIFCEKESLRSVLKKVYKTIPKGVVPFTTVGGAFALDSEINRGDCIITNEGTPTIQKERMAFYSKLGIKQVDFEKGPKTFIQGDFSFPLVGSAGEFKNQVTEPLYDAGIISILHVHAFYIDYNSTEILGNPKWQKQLEFRESYELKKDISDESEKIEINGNITSLLNNDSYWRYHSPFILINEEIIKYSLDKNGLFKCQRGQCGTIAKSHNAGAKVRIIGGQFACIAPQIGSELYYEIARRIANAYNEGGFHGIYLDAYDGLPVHLNYDGLGDYLWYYGAAFVNEVVRNCKDNPLIEYSSINPTVWAARGRGGAWDTPCRGYKNFIDDHINANKTIWPMFYVTTLGWYNFYPIDLNEPENYSTKYMFFDDVDYLGSKAIAYDQTMVFNGLKESDINSLPAMRRNVELYCKYNNLRREDYFTAQVKNRIKEGQYEYKLERQGTKWVFREVTYSRRKLRNIAEESLTGVNPFFNQQPFIRIENLYSSECNESIELMRFDDSKEFINQNCEREFSPSINISKQLGIRVEVKGNGLSSTDGICIRLKSSSFSGFADYIVRLNFEGWRTVILTDLDNAENPDLKFWTMENNLYKIHRKPIDFSKISSISVYKSGDCKNVIIRRIEAVPLVKNQLIDPVVHIGNSYIKFKTVLQSGEYVEYQPRQRKAIVFDRFGNAKQVVAKRNKGFSVPEGIFQAHVTDISAYNNIPHEVVLTIGLKGGVISN